MLIPSTEIDVDYYDFVINNISIRESNYFSFFNFKYCIFIPIENLLFVLNFETDKKSTILFSSRNPLLSLSFIMSLLKFSRNGGLVLIFLFFGKYMLFSDLMITAH